MNLLGIDIGGTKIAVTIGNDNGELFSSLRIDNNDRAPDAVIPEIIEAGKKLVAEHSGTQGVEAVGIGAPAPCDIPNGIIVSPFNMPKWKNVHITSIISDAFGVQAFFDNDANAGALAEWFFGAGQGCRNMIYLTLSTGIGGGIIAEKRLLHGAANYAGELGHVVLDINGPECSCGLRGCYEAFCGGRSIAARLKNEIKKDSNHPLLQYCGGNPDLIDMKILETAVRDDNPYAVKFWDTMCMRNAQAIGQFMNIFNPEKIILGTIAWASGELFMKPLKQYLSQFSWPETANACDVTVTALGREIGEYSGIAVALNSLYEKGKWTPPFLP